MDIVSIGYWAVLALAGTALGFLNTLASSGSAVSLPILVMLGLPEGAANATNRLPVLVGFAMATLTFARKGDLDWSAAWKLGIPMAAGALIGVYCAELIPDRQMGILITGAVLIAFVLLFTKTKDALSKVFEHPPHLPTAAIVLMFFVGLWFGLIVLDGATYLLLVLILICFYPLPNANALKVFLGALATLIAIVVFWGDGEMRWVEGGVLSVGSIVGGYFGAQLSSHMLARVWAFRLLVLVILLEVIHLAWHYSAPLRAEL